MVTRRDNIVIWIASVVSVCIVTFAFFMRSLTGMLIYDTHMEQTASLNRSLSQDQQKFLGFCFDYMANGYISLLVFTNVLWIGVVFYWCRRHHTKDGQNQGPK